jgi:hypothetical protein
VLYYRADLLRQAGNRHAPGRRRGDLPAAAGRPACMASSRAAARQSIRYDWTPFLQGASGAIVRARKQRLHGGQLGRSQTALDRFIRAAQLRIGVLGQSDVIQLLATGRAARGWR